MMQFWFRMFLVLVFCSVASVPLKIVLEPSSAVVAQNVTLNCEFEHYYSENDEILWEFSTHEKHILVWRSFPGTKELREQDQHFSNRTHVKFRHNKASLTLQNISLSDSGDYRCIIIKKGKPEHSSSTFVKLIISAPYSPPVITILNKTDKLFLQCISNGGYPESDVVWHYRNGSKLIDSTSTQHISNGMGTFNTSSNISLRLQNDADLCCTVINTVMQKNWTTCTDGAAQQQRHHYMIAPAFAVVLVHILILHQCKSRDKT